MKQEIMDIFEAFYLDESQKSVKLCMQLIELTLEKENPSLLPLPPYKDFLKAANSIPTPIIQYFRFGAHRAKREPNTCPVCGQLRLKTVPNEVFVCKGRHNFDGEVNRNC